MTTKAVEVHTQAEIEAKILKHNAVLYIREKKANPEIISVLERHLADRDDTKVLTTASPELKRQYSRTEALVLFKMFESEASVFAIDKSVDLDDLSTWLEFSAGIPVQEFDYASLNEVEKGGIVMFYYFFNSNFGPNIKLFYKEAKANLLEEDLIFVKGDFAAEETKDMLETLKLRKEDLPAVGAVKMENDQILKYRIDEGRLADFSSFVKKVAKGEEEPFFASESSEDQSNEVVVGQTFKAKVLEEVKPVLLFVFLKDCDECDAIEKLFKAFKKQSNGFVVLRMNGDYNEFSQFDFERESVMLFQGETAERRKLSFRVYEDDFTRKDLENWINGGNSLEEEIKQLIQENSKDDDSAATDGSSDLDAEKEKPTEDKAQDSKSEL